MRFSLARFRPKFLNRFAKANGGATTLEFAMVVFPFIYVLGCICETGVMLFTEYVIQSSVQEAARTIRTGASQGTTMTAAQFKAKICSRVSILVNCDGKVTVYVQPATTFSNMKSTLPSYLNVGVKDDGTPNPTSYNTGVASQPVAVIATYDWTFVFPFMNFLGNVSNNSKRRLAGMAIFCNEPFPGSAGAGTC
jgi:Flp pilus assembly protein TadG